MSGKKSGRRRPRSGLPRLWSDLRCAEAAEIRRQVQTLSLEHPGAPRDALIDAALRRVRWQQAEADLSRARQQRTTGRGRRPSGAVVRRFQKRAGQEWESHLQALARLRELARASKRAPASGSELLDRAHAAARTGL
jgi:hypothetical protein